MNKVVIIGIIIAVAIGIAVSSSSLYPVADDENNGIEVEDMPETEPKQFSVELREEIGVGETP